MTGPAGDENVSYLAEHADRNDLITPELLCRDAMMDYQRGELTQAKALILFLDDTDGMFDVRFRSAQMKCSEMLAVLRCFEAKLLRMMNHAR